MTKQEVIEGLECHAGAGGCSECPYDKMFAINNKTCVEHLALDTINLIEEQENGIEPKVSKEEDGYTWYYCSKCEYEIDPSYENYCPLVGLKLN